MNNILTRGVDEIIEKENLEKKLASKKKLRVKLGVDPTSPNIHLGRSIPLLKLRDFQEAGHQIIFIIGDFTAQIGDTSDKDSERPMLTAQEVKKNMASYLKQASKIIDIKKAEFYYNSRWLNKLNYQEINKQANAFSVNEFISRDNIDRRLKVGKRVSLREVLYPLMQGYDSVKVKSDVEVGGSDQRFNMLAGRDMQRLYNQIPQDIITNPLIEGLDGRKMSSSFGNTINLDDSPNDMFGKIMSLQDNLIIKYFSLLTRVDINQINEYWQKMEDGENPRNIKIKLAEEIVSFYYSPSQATKALDYFVNTFSKKEIPNEMDEIKPQSYILMDILIESKLVSSRGEVRRLIQQKGIKVNGEVVSDENTKIPSGAIVQKGKIKFIKVI
jgi:tyrosyl-tRNA synthetase